MRFAMGSTFSSAHSDTLKEMSKACAVRQEEFAKLREEISAANAHWQARFADISRQFQTLRANIHPTIEGVAGIISRAKNYHDDISSIARQMGAFSITPIYVDMGDDSLRNVIARTIGATRIHSASLSSFHRIDTSIFLSNLTLSVDIGNLLSQAFDANSPIWEEQRVRDRIMNLGFVPHAILFEHLEDIEPPATGREEFVQEVAHKLWQDIKPKLVLSLSQCLNDQRLFRTFGEIVEAHDSGLYETTSTSAFSLIERAARLAQSGPTRKHTKAWLRDGLGDLTFHDIPSEWRRGWTRVWAVLYEQAYFDLRTDERADALRFPHRHASAHGFGAKLKTVLDSFNIVLITHFVIMAADAYVRFTHEKLEECA